uniref:PP2C family serine/threonine-protein phosphatase n=1 Tax=Vibrio alfacsensis TaxID=1074311 RepID=UPI0013E2A53C|nr:PP2C family serine/threonine-protein phosphatase [Vibrio alfacsensis]
MSHYVPLLPYSDPQVPFSTSASNWTYAAQSVVGYRHIESSLPCQDACCSQANLRPIAILCDGAGSAKLSHLGSQGLTAGLLRLCSTLEPLLMSMLDTQDTPNKSDQALFGNLLARHSKGIIKDLATTYQQQAKEFRSTLLMAVVGRYRSLWLQVGDGFILTRNKRSHEWTVLTPPAKGEFANQTCFVDASLSLNQVQSGWLENQFDAVMLLSDGSAEKLVDNRSHTPANKACNSLLSWLEDDKSANKNLHYFLSDPKIWCRSTGDDKSIALLGYQEAKQHTPPFIEEARYV